MREWGYFYLVCQIFDCLIQIIHSENFQTIDERCLLGRLHR
jgi:hypothetical protein